MSIDFEFQQKTFSNHKRQPNEFKEIATEIRRDIIKSLTLAKSGHSGGSLGCADIFSVLYFGGFMNFKIDEPKWAGRDRFILSAGHLCPVLYATLARAGFFPTDELRTLRKFGSRLQGHPGIEKGLPGLEASTGSLGHGVSIAVGMAISEKFIDKSKKRIFTLTGDGELEEGTVWESAMAAGSFKLNNLCWIVDNNDCQIDGRVRDVMNIYPIDKKFESFNFNVICVGGHNYSQLQSAFEQFIENSESSNGKPTVIIAKTLMGKGISFMEDRYEWHGVPPNEEQALIALNELENVN